MGERQRRNRRLAVFASTIAVVLFLSYPYMEILGRKVWNYDRIDGVWVRRLNDSTIAVSLGLLADSVVVSLRGDLLTLGRTLGMNLPELFDDVFSLSSQPRVWMFDVQDYYDEWSYEPFVNPKLENTLLQLKEVRFERSRKDPDWNLVTKLAAQNYVFFGYAVRSENDLELLKLERSKRTIENVEEDIVMMDGRTLYRLRAGVEKELVSPESGETAEEIRASIPFLIERPNVELGHPLDELHVLYLDGTIEVIPFGEKFPATQALIDFLKTD